MSTSAFKHPLAILTVLGGLLIAAAPASAQQGEIARDTLSRFPADHSAFTAAEPETLSCELVAVASASAHGAGAGIVYNGHAGLGANSIAVSKGSIELIVTNNNDPDTMGRCLLSGGGESTVEGGLMLGEGLVGQLELRRGLAGGRWHGDGAVYSTRG